MNLLELYTVNIDMFPARLQQKYLYNASLYRKLYVCISVCTYVCTYICTDVQLYVQEAVKKDPFTGLFLVPLYIVL
jgi:hypothetical protein